LATFYDAFIRPLLTTSPFVDLGFDYFGFIKPLSIWPVTNYGDLNGLPDPSLTKMAVFPTKVLLLSGTADPFHTVTSTQKALGDLISSNMNATILKQTPVTPTAPNAHTVFAFQMTALAGACLRYIRPERRQLGVFLFSLLCEPIHDYYRRSSR
jgi:hypothetical protein